ncbi:hypothetical protein [Niabella hirudinis]|uniref:hypothetical protein n=1 Tax=Niabella hirudinis TaxID=1285929 RepID=UPI003EB9DC47
MKPFYTLVAMLMFAVASKAGGIEDSLFHEQVFSFQSHAAKMELKGTLVIPEKFSSKGRIVILATPPLPLSGDYGGLFKSLAETLGKRGIASLRFDNRAYTDTAIGPEETDMFDQADDLDAALSALRGDARFKNAVIGLAGHSEGGASVAIAASQGKQVDFIVLLSAIGISGRALTNYQVEQSTAALAGGLSTGARDTLLQVSKKYIEIISNAVTIDVARNEIGAFNEGLIKQSPDLLGRNQTIGQFNKVMGRGWINRHKYAYIRFRPELYYKKINCPVLALCGKFDENLDCRTNLDGIKNLMASGGNKQVTMWVIDSLNHGYQKATEKVIRNPWLHYAKSGKPPGFSIATWNRIADWIKEQH